MMANPLLGLLRWQHVVHHEGPQYCPILQRGSLPVPPVWGERLFSTTSQEVSDILNERVWKWKGKKAMVNLGNYHITNEETSITEETSIKGKKTKIFDGHSVFSCAGSRSTGHNFTACWRNCKNMNIHLKFAQWIMNATNDEKTNQKPTSSWISLSFLPSSTSFWQRLTIFVLIKPNTQLCGLFWPSFSVSMLIHLNKQLSHIINHQPPRLSPPINISL